MSRPSRVQDPSPPEIFRSRVTWSEVRTHPPPEIFRGAVHGPHLCLKVLPPSRYTTSKQRRINVEFRFRPWFNVDSTFIQHSVPAGQAPAWGSIVFYDFFGSLLLANNFYTREPCIKTLQSSSNWSVDYICNVLLENASIIWRCENCRWRAVKLGLCSAIGTFEQGGGFKSYLPCHTCFDRGPWSHPQWHLYVCRKRRLNGAFLRMRPEKPRPRVTAGVAQ
jgi:hypothetical protein